MIKDDILKKIYNFSLPRYEELTDLEIYNNQLVSIVENYLKDLNFNNNEKIITITMVQNYVKLNLLPKPIKKKYNKEHIAFCIVISILKNVLSIQQIKDAIDLQLIHLEKADAYNYFADNLELVIKFIFKPLLINSNENLNYKYYENIEIPNEKLAMSGALAAFSFKLLVDIIIYRKGVKNLIE